MSYDACKAMLKNLAKLHDGAMTDFEIKCRGYTWKVHRVVLILHSNVLTRACSGNFREAQEGFIDLSEDDPFVVARLVEYFYHLEYEYEKSTGLAYDEEKKTQKTPPCPFPEPVLHVHMAIIADKYNIAPLADLAYRNFYTDDPALLALVVAEAYGIEGPTKNIRNCIVRRLVVDHQMLEHPAIEEVMHAFPQLPIDVARFSAPRLAEHLGADAEF